MIRRPPRSTLDRSSAASDVYKRQGLADAVTRFIVGKPGGAGIRAARGDAIARIVIGLSLIHISEPTRPY